MHQQNDDLPPEKLDILRNAFQQLVSNHTAVSSHHRMAIARRVIVAARGGFNTTDELVAIANALPDDPLHEG